MSRKKSSHLWLKEHFADPYVKQAQQQGYRSRAAFKLLEIQEKDKLIKPGMRILELGAAPGGWSQIIIKLLNGRGELYATDILPMDPLPGMIFLQGDFTDEHVIKKLLTLIPDQCVDLVISDMAPNTTGIASVDQLRSIHLAEIALDVVQQVLRTEGAFLVKVFQGAGFMELRQLLMQSFKQVVTRKPKASRARSKEAYLLARGYNIGKAI